MLMPGRKYKATSSSNYRYGFNTQERDEELSENIYTAEYWEYDSRIVRRWNTDPDVTADESPYAVNHNNPIVFNDPDGDFPGLGFLVGFVTEFVIQTIEIKLNVRKDYDVYAMAISGVATQLGMGIAKQISKIKTLGTLTKTVTQVGKDVAINLGEQGAKTLYDPTAKVSVTDALINGGVSKIAGDFAESAVKQYSSKGAELVAKAEKKADRVSKANNAKRVAELKKAEEAVEGYVAPRALVAAVPATGAATRTYDAFKKTPSTTDLNTKAATTQNVQTNTNSITPAATTTTQSNTRTYTKQWVKDFGKYYKDSESFSGPKGTTIKNPYYKKKG